MPFEQAMAMVPLLHMKSSAKVTQAKATRRTIAVLNMFRLGINCVLGLVLGTLSLNTLTKQDLKTSGIRLKI